MRQQLAPTPAGTNMATCAPALRLLDRASHPRRQSREGGLSQTPSGEHPRLFEGVGGRVVVTDGDDVRGRGGEVAGEHTNPRASLHCVQQNERRRVILLRSAQ